VRVCPVKAIRVQDGQASVHPKRCLSCGTCIRECPQGAKTYRRDLDKVREILARKNRVAVSIAPSFAGFLREWEWRRLPSALRKLGFCRVEETAVGAWHAAHTLKNLLANSASRHTTLIESSCPAVVNYIERYRPDRVPDIAPVLSPMMSHARLLKELHGLDLAIVFVGPCVAKKSEAERPEHAGLVEAVLTFEELFDWFLEENIDLAQLEESAFDAEPGSDARYYPLLGGCLQTAEIASDKLSDRVLSASGFDEVREVLQTPQDPHLDLIEALFCPEGCIGGPAIPSEGNPFERRLRLIQYVREQTPVPGQPVAVSHENISFTARFCPKPVDESHSVSELAIRQALERTGKIDPENQLNCGACGYPTCRDKAIAVCLGLAEAEMCLPYMRHLAERRTDRIIETSPNGIVLLNERLEILSMNAAFRKLFYCSNALLGKHISLIVDPEMFERLAAGTEGPIEETIKHSSYNRICHQIVYRLPQDQQFVGLFINVTETRKSQEELEALRSEALRQAHELLEHQIQMAQEMTRFLGENTARGEELVENLMTLVRQNSSNPNPEPPNPHGLPAR
jgi:iron only hydrogenase large subunit-like protein